MANSINTDGFNRPDSHMMSDECKSEAAVTPDSIWEAEAARKKGRQQCVQMECLAPRLKRNVFLLATAGLFSVSMLYFLNRSKNVLAKRFTIKPTAVWTKVQDVIKFYLNRRP